MPPQIRKKSDELAGADPPPNTTSDVYAVTAGVKGGSFPPLKNLGISMSASALSLHLRTNISSYFVKFFSLKSSIFQAVNYIFGPFPLEYGTSNIEIRIPRPKIHRNRSQGLILSSISLNRIFLHQFYPRVCLSSYYTVGRNLVKNIRHNLYELFSHFFRNMSFSLTKELSYHHVRFVKVIKNVIKEFQSKNPGQLVLFRWLFWCDCLGVSVLG